MNTISFCNTQGFGSARIRMFLPCPDPDPHKFADPDQGKKVMKWMNKSLFCRVGDVQCKQFHFFCSDFKHPLLRIIWNVKKTHKKKIIFSLYPQSPPPDPHEDFCPDPDPKKNADPKPWLKQLKRSLRGKCHITLLGIIISCLSRERNQGSILRISWGWNPRLDKKFSKKIIK